MAGPNPNDRNKPRAPIDLPPELIQQFLETQKQKAINEAKELQIREKEIDYAAKSADKALEFQASHMASIPSESRKTVKTIGGMVIVFVVLFLGCLSWWLYMGKEEFAYKFLQIAGYFITTGLGYYFGRKGKKDSKSDMSNDSEVSD